MDKFIARENVLHLCTLLHAETDPQKRAQLNKFLVEEEDKLGVSHAQLEFANRLIADGGVRMARQLALVDHLFGNGHDTSAATRLLDLMRETFGLFEDYRRKILATIENNRL